MSANWNDKSPIDRWYHLLLVAQLASHKYENYAPLKEYQTIRTFARASQVSDSGFTMVVYEKIYVYPDVFCCSYRIVWFCHLMTGLHNKLLDYKLHQVIYILSPDWREMKGIHYPSTSEKNSLNQYESCIIMSKDRFYNFKLITLCEQPFRFHSSFFLSFGSEESKESHSWLV